MTRGSRFPWLGPLPVALLLPLLALLALLPAPSAAAPEKAKDMSGNNGCRLQDAKAFLKRSAFVRRGQLDGKKHLTALKYRVERYGHVDGLGLEKLNSETAISNAASARFMGHSLSVHKKIVPALRCVEKRIRKTCKKRAEQYTANAVGGFRTANSFRGGEVSNHLFGIAVDIDPEKNPCCGCVSPWPEHPACQGSAASIFERTALPRCWIDAFERYGFYWLGRDPDLRDTMHFEFLGDPDRIIP
ncbi:MAG TPA: M15 family metallopeptidase [Polyangiaceae bacterium]|jgi:hypothetical protein|nr:M15 family metallopeptidase [Polyangiaceae bacterium]